MVRKGVAVWVFSTLSFIAAIHALEAALWLFFDRAPVLLKNYPIINELNVNPLLYFSSSAFIHSYFGE